MKYVKEFFLTYIQMISVIMLLVILNACGKEPASPAPIIIPPPVVIDTNANLKTYLALGDSYTIGQSVTIDQRFPVQTKLLLGMQGIQMKQPDIIANTGWTTGNLLSTLSNNPPSNNYDVVSLLIGVNNQYQGRSQDEYRLHFTDLLNKAVSYAGGRKNRVFVLSIPDYSVTPFAQNSDTARIAREINEFNQINKQITTLAGITYLDITAISREASTDASLTASDGLHPSGKQYGRWATLLSPLMKAVL